MATISRLKFDELQLNGEVDERLPRHIDKLHANFPLDGIVENNTNTAEIYVENNTIKSKGLYDNIIKNSSNVTVENGAMKFTGNTNSFLELNPEALNGANDFSIELKIKHAGSSNTISGILNAGRLNGKGKDNEIGLNIRNGHKSLYVDMWNVDVESSPGDVEDRNVSYFLSAPGDINSDWVKITLIRKNGILCSYINDNFYTSKRVYGNLVVDKLYIGQENDATVGNGESFDITQSYEGLIEYIKINKYDSLAASGGWPTTDVEGLNQPILGDVSKYVNRIIDKFTVCFESKIKAAKANVVDIFSLGTNASGSEYLGFRRLQASENTIKLNTLTETLGTINNASSLVDHKLFFGFSYDKALKKLIAIVYDKTTKTVLLDVEKTNLSFTAFNKMLIRESDTDIISNLSFYSKALSKDTLMINCYDSFSIQDNGNIILDNFNERESVHTLNPNIYFLPLDSDQTSTCGRLKPTNQLDMKSFDGGTLVGGLRADMVIDLTRAASEGATSCGNSYDWDKKLHGDAYRISGWMQGYNAGVVNPTVGYHAKWVKEGPGGKICAKFINKNTSFGVANRWLGMSRMISTTEFGLWNSCKVGDKIKISFKAMADQEGAFISVGIFRSLKSTGDTTFENKDVYVPLSTDWREYSIEQEITQDWDLTKLASLYFYGYDRGAFISDSTRWVTDIVLTKTNVQEGKLPSEVLYNLDTNQNLKFNLNRDIGLNWNTPWTICYWKKTFGFYGGSDTNEYVVDSIGSNHNTSKNRGYIFIGGSNLKDKLVCNYTDTDGSTFRTIIDVNKKNDFYDQWQFITMRYDGSKLTAKIQGEKHEDVILDKTKAITDPKFFLCDTNNYDLMIGGYDNNYSGAATIKNLLIAKSALTDTQLDNIYRNKMSYKNGVLDLNVKLNEINL